MIRDLSLTLNQGELVSLLGVNGAGKTTTINIILGLEKPTSGEASLLGHAPGSIAAKRQVGVTPQNSGFPEGLSVKEIIEFIRSHYKDPLTLNEVAEQFNLTPILNQRTNKLSGGQKRRLAVAQAFIGKPKCVFLDEPTTGLDVESRRSIWKAVKQYLKNKGSVFLTTHYLEEAEALSDRVVIIDQGVIKFEGTVDKIKELAGLARVCFIANAMIGPLSHVEKIEQNGHNFILHTHQVDELIRELVHKNIEFHDLKIIESSLESAYLQITEEARQ